MNEYIIKPGDNFYRLAQHKGCSWQDFVEVNPGIDPCCLQVGQKIRLPETKRVESSECCGELRSSCSGDNRCDEVLIDIAGAQFRVTRNGEPKVPHEVHMIIPRIEIRKVEHPQSGIIETTIMISNINIVNSPRREGEGGGSKE
ncbi:MAG TPA: LysM peptidoglycan-binding domain-containing protein [Peptococcaceae bacterium]|nr:LysM peptidoglycan-binding domain-containing protein [Peptococcaceae bacterium]